MGKGVTVMVKVRYGLGLRVRGWRLRVKWGKELGEGVMGLG